MVEQEDLMAENGEDVEIKQEQSALELTEQVEQLERDKAQLAQQLLRLKADFDNFRRRTKTQIEEITEDANGELLLELLPILDNFERALDSECNEGDFEPFVRGVEMVYQGLMNTLSSHGLQPIVAKGEPFNPCLYEAIAMHGAEDEDLIVLEEVQTGYLFNEKILRHTKVLVGQNKEENECQK